MIKIDLHDTYQPISINLDFSQMTFHSPQSDGTYQRILVKIEHYNDPYLPNVFNLGFGPPNCIGSFHDNLRLKHKNISKVYSTVLYFAYKFLKIHKDLTL